MNTLRNHTIVYDDECPACAGYTQLFVDTKMFEKKGRQPYKKMQNKLKEHIDWIRASNEIALVDHQTGKVKYGIDSLFKIFEYNFPALRHLFQIRAFRWLMTKLYFFISYNRKVIVPGKHFEGNSACAPSMNYKYRLVYLLFTWLLTSLVLTYYSGLLAPFVPPTNFWREFAICGGQIVFQAAIVGLVFRERLIYYLGNLMTISFAGALLLAPVFLLDGLSIAGWVFMAYFMLVVGLMFLEHIRRVKTLSLPWFISATWVLYRLFVLYIIL